MRRLLPIALILLSPVAFAQTTLDITVPGGQVCSYATGPVSNGTAPGHLQATATSSSGSGCGSGSSGNVTFGPATPVAASPVTVYNGTSSVSFQALNANTKCVGTIAPATGSFVGGNDPLCTGSACQTPVTVTAQFDNENATAQPYTVSVTCTGTSGQATSQTTVSVPGKGQQPPPDGCFNITNSAGGQFVRMTGNIQVTLSDNTLVSRDATSFNSVFGTTDNPLWPGHGGLVTLPVPVDKYLSLAFKVPDNFYGTPPNVGDIFGRYTINATGKTANISMSISTKCGDFSASGGASTAICRADNKPAGAFITWWAYPDTACSLQNGQSYFLNIVNAEISTVLPNGGGTATSLKTSKCSTTCADPIINGNKTWVYP